MSDSRPEISIIIPVLNEAERLAAQLDALATWRAAGDEVIVVDGGSSDDSATLARSRCDRVVSAARGRASQMNAGAALARGCLLWFLHADTRPQPALRQPLLDTCRERRCWGRFDVSLEGGGIYRVIATAMNLRSRLSGIATGDQGIFVTREVFAAVGGYPALPLMEDLAFSRRMLQFDRPVCLRGPLAVSPRRWRRHGVVRTITLMWWLRLAWFCGVSPKRLARWYGYEAASGDEAAAG